MCKVIDVQTGWKADLIVRKDRPFSREEFGRRLPAQIGDIGLYVATAEDTILAKLEWRKVSESEQQLRDVVGVLCTQDVDGDYLRHWADDLGISRSLGEALAAAGKA